MVKGLNQATFLAWTQQQVELTSFNQQVFGDTEVGRYDTTATDVATLTALAQAAKSDHTHTESLARAVADLTEKKAEIMKGSNERFQDEAAIQIAQAAIHVWEDQIEGLLLERKGLIEKAVTKKEELTSQAKAEYENAYNRYASEQAAYRGYDRYDLHRSLSYPPNRPRDVTLEQVTENMFPTTGINQKIQELQVKIANKQAWLAREQMLEKKPIELIWLDGQIDSVVRWEGEPEKDFLQCYWCGGMVWSNHNWPIKCECKERWR